MKGNGFASVLLVWAAAMPLCGCERAHTGKLTTGTSPASNPKTRASRKVAPTPRKDVPIVYDGRLDPIPLRPAHVEEILDNAEPIAPPGRRVWYIHVHNSYVHKGEHYWAVTVFYTPGVATDRIRKGKATRFTSSWKLFADVRRKFQEASSRPAPQSPPLGD